MLTTQSFTVYKDAIPASCFTAGGRVRARVGGVEGVDTVDMEINSITSGSGETDVVSLIYNKDDTGGVTLSNCNIKAFFCLADCCSTVLNLVGYHENGDMTPTVGAENVFRMGVIPKLIEVDRVKIWLPSTLSNETSERICRVYLQNTDGEVALFPDQEMTADEMGISLEVHRADFQNFTDGRLPAGHRINVYLVDDSTGTVLDVAGPLQISFLGRYIP